MIYACYRKKSLRVLGYEDSHGDINAAAIVVVGRGNTNLLFLLSCFCSWSWIIL